MLKYHNFSWPENIFPIVSGEGRGQRVKIGIIIRWNCLQLWAAPVDNKNTPSQMTQSSTQKVWNDAIQSLSWMDRATYFLASALRRSSSAFRSFSCFMYSSSSPPSKRILFRTYKKRRNIQFATNSDIGLKKFWAKCVPVEQSSRLIKTF